MRTFITLFLLFLALSAKADDIDYPILQERVKVLDDFIPSGWDLLDDSKGDLNKDGFDDYVFVLQSRDSIMSDEFGNWSGVYFPRILGIVFWNESYNGYELKVQSNDFIITTKGHKEMYEPFEGLNVLNGTVRFNFHHRYSVETWHMRTQVFVFKYQKDRFELIGQERTSMDRLAHAYIKESINYTTKKAVLYTKENLKDGGRTRTATFELDNLYTFDTVGEAGSLIKHTIDYGD